MKILVVIVNYGTNQLKYLERMIKEFQSMRFDIDIVVHSNIPLKYKGVEVIIEKLDNYEKLPFTTRKTIYKKRNDYDIYIYSENDHLFTQKHIEAFITVTKLLPEKYIAGFLQFEEYDGKRFYPGYHLKFGWDKNILFKIKNYIFAHFTNVHQGSFILTKKQLNHIIKNFDFLNQTLKQRYSFLYRTLLSLKHRYYYYFNYLSRFDNIVSNKKLRYLVKLITENIDIFNQVYFSNYSAKCRAGTDVYTHGGYIKVIPISHFDDFLIHHMPNNYKGRLGKSEIIMKEDLKKLIKIANQRKKNYLFNHNQKFIKRIMKIFNLNQKT